MQTHSIIAVDGGAAGGIAWKIPGNEAACIPMPKTDAEIVGAIQAIVRRTQEARCGLPIVFVEDIVKHMGTGIPASTMAVYASNWGMIKGSVLYAGCRLELVRPQQWQKALGLGITGRQKANVAGMSEGGAKAEKERVRLLNGQLKRDWKKKLQGEAQRLFPILAVAGKVTLGTADALLILEHGLRLNR